MKLTELEPEWLRHTGCDIRVHERVESMERANGIFFLCPLCFEKNGRSNIGVHGVICWHYSVPLTVFPRPGRWDFIGHSFEDLTIAAAPGRSRSVLLLSGCRWHGFVTNGIVT